MTKGQRDRLKRSFEVFSRSPWDKESLIAVLKEVAINYPGTFLTCCGTAINEAPSSVFDGFNFSGLKPRPLRSQPTKSYAPCKQQKAVAEKPCTHAPVAAATDLTCQTPESPQEPAPQAPSEPSKPVKPRPAKQQVSKAPLDQAPATNPSEEVNEEPTEMTGVVLEAFDPNSQYLLSRALMQATGSNESRIKALLEGSLPVEVDSFCRKEHANSLRRSLVRIKGTVVSLKTTPIAAKK